MEIFMFFEKNIVETQSLLGEVMVETIEIRKFA